MQKEVRHLAKYILLLSRFCIAAKNGVYVSLVKDVRDAFELSPLVKVDCPGLEPSDYKKIGAKLKVYESFRFLYIAITLKCRNFKYKQFEISLSLSFGVLEFNLLRVLLVKKTKVPLIVSSFHAN